MAFSRTVAHATAADGSFSAAGVAAWDGTSAHTPAVAGADVGGIPYCPTATTETTSANLTYAETSGPRLKVGTSGTSQGWLLGYGGSNGVAMQWLASLTPSGTNYSLYSDVNNTILNAATNTILRVGGSASQNQLLMSSTAGAGPAITAGTATTDVNALSATQTWNAAGVTFTGIKYTITDTASAAGSLAMQILGGASGTTGLISVGKGNGFSTLTVGDGSGTNAGAIIGTHSSGLFGIWNTGVTPSSSNYNIAAATGTLYFMNNAVNVTTNTLTVAASNTFRISTDSVLSRGGVNQFVYNAGGAGGGTATSRAEINKAVTAFTDGVAKTVFTLTIPNAAHSASYLVRVTGSIGAGGAIGANEASATSCYVVTLTRTAGVNAVGGISAAFGASTSAVAGATTVTCTAALAAVSGAVGATNTIDIQATITKGGGASDNHTCVATASLLNANATGITIA